MKPRRNLEPRGNQGLALVELLVVVLILVILAGMIPYAPRKARSKAERITCVNNLKNIGLAHRVFATDSMAGFPWSYSTNENGSAEFIENPETLWRHFMSLTNELTTPKLLVCPSDKRRIAAASFVPTTNLPTQFVFRGNHQLSYFLGLNAAEEQPQSILAGDRNVSTNGIPLAPGRHVLDAGTQLGFTAEMHNLSGNILLGDGSVQQVTSGRLTGQFQDALKSARLTTNMWLIP